MGKRKSQKAHQLRVKKHKARCKVNLAKKRERIIQATKKAEKENEELKQKEEKSKKWYMRIRRALKHAKWWIVENIWIRILNIFRNLFKKYA